MNASAAPLPLVVQVGFAGSRELLPPDTDPAVDAVALEAGVAERLRARLERLPAELGLGPRHFLCGISQVAVGADTLFTQACASLGWSQRVYLPDDLESYVTAQGRKGPDFLPAEQHAARELAKSPHVVEVRVVSDAHDRHERFEDANLAIARDSDVVVCLVRAGASGSVGGTRELIDLAKKRDCPVLELRLSLKDGTPVIEEQWHHHDQFRLPALPPELASATLAGAQATHPPEVADYCAALKAVASRQANWKRRLFKGVALVIIGAHLLATLCAVVALESHGAASIPWLLGVEVGLLSLGFGVHRYLHGSHSCKVWAVSRFVAELARSVQPIGRLHLALDYLFTLPFPAEFEPLLETLAVLHLRSTRVEVGKPWEPMRDAYLEKRLTGAGGQIEYHRRTRDHARRWQGRARWSFIVCTLGAMAATATKLCLHFGEDAAGGVGPEFWPGLLGALAILLPVLAVAGLSLAAAFDLEARVHTSGDMLAFLEKQCPALKATASRREFARLVLETESRLVGETANWYARRSFTGVA